VLGLLHFKVMQRKCLHARCWCAAPAALASRGTSPGGAVLPSALLLPPLCSAKMHSAPLLLADQQLRAWQCSYGTSCKWHWLSPPYTPSAKPFVRAACNVALMRVMVQGARGPISSSTCCCCGAPASVPACGPCAEMGAGCRPKLCRQQ
jgi:hypothetical protein